MKNARITILENRYVPGTSDNRLQTYDGEEENGGGKLG